MFSVDHKSGRELRQYLSSVADQCEHGSAELPCVIILDSLHHVTSLSEVFNGFLSVHYQSRYSTSSGHQHVNQGCFGGLRSALTDFRETHTVLAGHLKHTDTKPFK